MDEVTRAASGLDSVEAYKSPTGRLGVWVTLERDRPRNRIRLFRTSSEETEQLDFGDDCAPAVTRLPRVVPEGYLTDHELEGLLQRHDSLVVYLWSPHLPLSVDGYREIEAATAALGVGLLAVVDPSSDPDFVKRAAEAAAIPESARRPLGSVELLFRDLAVHAPSILVFRAGDALAPLPGYRTEVGYRQYLRTALRRAD